MTTTDTPASHAPANTETDTPPMHLDALEVRDRHVYCLGMGGCGMSGLARLLRARGAAVTGTDQNDSVFTRGLTDDGFEVTVDGTPQTLPDQCDLVIASAAIKPDHPQLLEADRRGIPHLIYAEALGRSMIGQTGVTVAGTHGKSTTTAMLGWTLMECGLDPSAVIGASCPQLAQGQAHGTTGFRLGAQTIPAGTRAGQAGIVIAEACEFNRSFHHFRPTIAAITSVEADHLDVYGSLEAVIESFGEFARLVAPESDGGHLLIAHEGAHRREVSAGVHAKVETIGYAPDADWSVSFDPNARTISVSHDHTPVGTFDAPMPGAHNAMNAASAFALACVLGADPAVAADALSRFEGLERRTQLIGERIVPGGAVKIYDDYGHHPTEIDQTLRALRQFERPEAHGGRLICVFQPHQHSRTRFLLDEFANAFEVADVVIVPHIYFVRDSIAEKQRVSAADLVDRLRQRQVQAMHLYPFEAIVEQLENVCRAGDLLVVMGAGPVNDVAYGYLKTGSGPADA